ncbi:unnamed protein product [Amoebophrya sp. A25]|nr:unnamed protein product [Amoebophrya sp. A25]|eukprot:GSA25T00010630001.1
MSPIRHEILKRSGASPELLASGRGRQITATEMQELLLLHQGRDASLAEIKHVGRAPKEQEQDEDSEMPSP